MTQTSAAVLDLRKHLDSLSADDLVFPSPEGSPLRHSNFYRRAWMPALAAAGLAGWSLAAVWGALSDFDHDSAAGSGFDGGVGVGYLIEGVSGSDAGAEAAVEQGFGEGAGCVGFDSGREVVASEQAQGGVFEAECPVGDGGVIV